MSDVMPYYTLALGAGTPDRPGYERDEPPFGLAYRTREAAAAAARAWLGTLPADHCGYTDVTCKDAGCHCHSENPQARCLRGLVIERRPVPGTDSIHDECDREGVRAVILMRTIEWRAMRRDTVTRTVEVDGKEYTRSDVVETVVKDWNRMTRYRELCGRTWVAIQEHAIRWAPGEGPR